MICSCCGFEIKGEVHLVEKGVRQVCEKCWNNPEIFFPEKIENDQRLQLLSSLAQSKGNGNGTVEVKAIKLVQKSIEMYIGKIKVNDILALYELDKFKDEELEGYQRERYEERTSELVEYLEKSPLAVMPALLVGLRRTNFTPIDEDLGILKIERKKGSLWIIDGQHRVGGFDKIQDRFLFTKSLGADLFSNLMDFELPVVFIDSTGAAQKIKPKEIKDNIPLSAEDIEKTIFFIVNKTQRGISPSLKDALLYSIKTSGIDGLSMIDKEGWRIMGAQIGIALNCRETSPLCTKINISGKRNSGKPLQLNSFVSSLEILFKDKEFSNLSAEDRIVFLETFWGAIRNLIPHILEPDQKMNVIGEEFGRRYASNIGAVRIEKSKNKRKIFIEAKYLLLSSLGIHTIHKIARDLFRSAVKEGADYKQKKYIEEKLYPISQFDWNSKTSPLAALGGMKGVSKAYELLSDVIGQEKCSNNQEKPLGNYSNR
jgi:DGQHR domain-containing protein